MFNATIAFPAFSQEDHNELWHHTSALPYRVQEIYPAVFEGHIVVAGGLSPDVEGEPIGVSDRVLVYRLDEKNW
jgi:hypothetical protein